jgi:hypothetical protein
MAYTYKDLDGKEHELYDSLRAEEMIDIVTNEVKGYRVKGTLTDDKISKETYEAIVKIRKR